MTLAEFMNATRKEFPGFEIRPKATSAFMRLVAKFLLVITFGTQKTFMASYTTTINTTVYTPEGFEAWTDNQKLAILRHERVHMRQAKKIGFPVFAFLYLFVPLPLGLAFFRAQFEWEAYTESMRAAVERNGMAILDDPKYKKAIFDHFTTGAYGWMWPFTGTLEKWWTESRKQLESEIGHV